MALNYLQDNINRDLTCPICTDLLKEPLTASCHHTFCKACIEKHITDATSQGKTDVKCLVCNTSIGDNIEHLTHNPVLLKLAENWKKWREDLQQNVDSSVCGICETSKPSIRCFLCENCCVVYCKDCREAYHPAMGKLAEHTLVPLVESGEFDNEDCRTHNKQFANFCSDCYKPFCSDEACFKEHEEHDITMLSRKYESEFQEIKAKLKNAAQKVEADKDTQNRYVEFRAMLENIKHRRADCIDDVFNEFARILDNRKKELLQIEEDDIGRRIVSCQTILKETAINNSNLQCILSLAEKATTGDKKVLFLLSSVSLNNELDIYTGIDFNLDDDRTNIPNVPDKIETDAVVNAIGQLSIETDDGAA